jgi:pimeloyl-ACP methyl ester carboxylesterase
MNFLCKIFGGSYDDLWKAIIRPGRDLYEQTELGPFKFEISNKCYKRTDFELINNRGLKIICSFWEPFDEEREKTVLPCVIYLHGNSSSRCEAYAEVKHLLPKNICLFSFDFCGCGKSEGDYISLGYYEKDDVKCIIEYLQKSKKVGKIALWGRSMGAVTAIMYASEHPQDISALVLDSGFYSLRQLIYELVKSKVNLPDFIIEQVLKQVKETIKEKAGFNLDDLETELYAKKCQTPAFFCHGEDDNFVNKNHCTNLFKDYKCENKIIRMVKGKHNTARPRELKKQIVEFLERYIKDIDFESDDTIINCNTYQGIIFNHNLVINYNHNFNHINHLNNSNNTFYQSKNKKNNHDRKINSTHKKMNLLKNSYNNNMFPLNKRNTDEKPLMSDRNASQNMRAYSFNKYSHNDLKVINRKNTDNINLKSMNINMINIKKNHFDEEYKSDISSDSKDEPILYMKKSITNKNNIKTRSASVDNEIIKKDMIKNLHKSVNNYSYSKSLAINNLKKSNIENERNLNNINYAGKTFQTFFFNPTSDNKQKHSNNINNINKRFNSSNVLFNNYRGIDPKKIGEDKNNFYAVKRPLDKQKQIFKKRQPTEELKPIIIKENNDKNLLRNISFKEEEEKTITINNTENTILDENEELIGRNIPH